MSAMEIVRDCLSGALFILLGIVTWARARRNDSPPGRIDLLHGMAGPLLIVGGIVLIVLNLLHFQ